MLSPRPVAHRMKHRPRPVDKDLMGQVCATIAAFNEGGTDRDFLNCFKAGWFKRAYYKGRVIVQVLSMKYRLYPGFLVISDLKNHSPRRVYYPPDRIFLFYKFQAVSKLFLNL